MFDGQELRSFRPIVSVVLVTVAVALIPVMLVPVTFIPLTLIAVALCVRQRIVRGGFRADSVPFVFDTLALALSIPQQIARAGWRAVPLVSGKAASRNSRATGSDETKAKKDNANYSHCVSYGAVAANEPLRGSG